MPTKRVLRKSAGRAVAERFKMNSEIESMISIRHEAHRRGNFIVQGSISLIETAHGALRFPIVSSNPTGPTIGYVLNADNTADDQKLVVLTEWDGLPDLHDKLPEQCPDCLRDCDVCGASGEKVCEGVGCGGNGWRPGPFVDCPGTDCMVQTGKFNPVCAVCRGFGQIADKVTCEMCGGKKTIKCSRCRGTGKYSTGLIGGQTDYLQPRCKTCNGEQRAIKVIHQVLEDHINALLPDPARGPYIAIGPIFMFAVDLTTERFQETGTPVRIFDVSADAAGDHMFLVIDSSSKPQWPYLIGGVILERANATALLGRSRKED